MYTRYTHDEALRMMTIVGFVTVFLCVAVIAYIVYSAIFIPTLNGLEDIISTETARFTAFSDQVTQNFVTNKHQAVRIQTLTEQVQELQKQIDLLHEMQSEK